MPREVHVPSLFELFLQYGYDGATLSKISDATGLGRASLYHHFPGGKNEMLASVLDYSGDWLEQNVLQLLAGDGSPQARLQEMCDRVNDFYAGGTQPCLLAIVQTGTGRSLFHEKVKAALDVWIKAIAAVLVESGLDETIAQQRGEDAIIAIQGSLMVSLSLDAPASFQRTIEQLPQMLCHPA